MASIHFDMIVFHEGDTYVAYCPELDVSSCGDTVDDARAHLRTAVRLFLEEAGYTPDGKGGYTPPRLVATESATVAVGG